MIHHSNTYLEGEESDAIKQVLAKGLLTKGDECQQLTNEFAEFIGVDHVRVTSSGSMAFYLTLLTLEIKQGDDVLLPDYICSDLLGPILAVGANPVLYDNAMNSYLATEIEIIARVTTNTRLVVLNHTYGFVNKRIEALYKALPRSIPIVEDCCHFISPKEMAESKYTRKFSICCFYSFNATKLLAAGEGGAISSCDQGFIKKLKTLRIGDNLSDLNCALARVQLKRLNFFISRRKEIGLRYLGEFKKFTTSDFDETTGVFFRFPLIVKDTAAFWKNENVSYRKGVDSLLSTHCKVQPMKNSFNILQSTVSIPIYPGLSDDQVKFVVDETKKMLN